MWKDSSTSLQIGQFGKIKEFAAKFTNKSRAIRKLEMGEETTNNSKYTKKNQSDSRSFRDDRYPCIWR